MFARKQHGVTLAVGLGLLFTTTFAERASGQYHYDDHRSYRSYYDEIDALSTGTSYMPTQRISCDRDPYHPSKAVYYDESRYANQVYGEPVYVNSTACQPVVRTNYCSEPVHRTTYRRRTVKQHREVRRTRVYAPHRSYAVTPSVHVTYRGPNVRMIKPRREVRVVTPRRSARLVVPSHRRSHYRPYEELVFSPRHRVPVREVKHRPYRSLRLKTHDRPHWRSNQYRGHKHWRVAPSYKVRVNRYEPRRGVSVGVHYHDGSGRYRNGGISVRYRR